MVKIIETNLSLENKGEGVLIHDHQSRVLEVDSWNEYINLFILYTGETVGNYQIPSNCIIKDLVYDEFHLSCTLLRKNGNIDGKMAYLIRGDLRL